MGVSELDGIYVAGVPHYSPDAMRRWIILCVSWMSVLSITAVSLRFYSRHLKRQKLWWDDYLIAFSMVWNWAVVAVGFAMYIKGAGYHAKDLPKESIENISMWLLVTEIIYVWNLCWTKLSLLFMYYRIFRFPEFKRLVIGAGTFVIVWAFTVSFLFTFICTPVQKLWKPELEGHCVNTLGVWLANCSATIFSDIMILCLPIPHIWSLSLKKSEKIGLTFVFGLGFFAVFASSYRTWVLFNYSRSDISYTLSPLLVWSDIEMCAGIISACLPILRPVVHVAAAKVGLGNVFSWSKKSNDGSRSGQNVPTIGSARVNRLNKNQSELSTAVSRGELDDGPFYRLPDLSEIDIESGHGELHSVKTPEKAHVIETDGYSEQTMAESIPMERLGTRSSLSQR